MVAFSLEISGTLGGITESMHSAVVYAVFLTTNVHLEVSFQILLCLLEGLNLSLPPIFNWTHFLQVYGPHPLDFEMPGHLLQ